jgi:hypothetical protein
MTRITLASKGPHRFPGVGELRRALRIVGCVTLLSFVATALSADEINISSQYLATVGQGDTVQINFGIADYASEAIADGYSPYPTGLDLLIAVVLPTSSSLSDFTASADLTSADGSVSIPMGNSPVGQGVGYIAGNELTLQSSTFQSNGGPVLMAGFFFGSVDFSSEVSQEIFTPADLVEGNTDAASIIVTNLGDPFMIGVSGYYANMFPIGGCCIAEVPGIRGDAPFNTGGETGTVLLTTPEPPGIACVLGGVLV